MREAPLPDRTMAALGRSAGLAVVTVRVKADASVCASPIVKAAGKSMPPSTIVMSAIAEIVGGVFTARETVTTNVRVAVRFQRRRHRP